MDVKELIARQVKILRPKKNIVQNAKTNVPDGMYTKCNMCSKTLQLEKIKENYYKCYHCGYNFRMRATDRINMLIDPKTFREFSKTMPLNNPLNFPGYLDKLEKLQKKTDLDEAVITGYCKIGGVRTVLAVMDSYFMMGSMGGVVGEKITRAIEKATSAKLPIIIISTSGGARMQEGIVSLMQMAKTSAALAKHSDAKQLYISVLTDPTTGGVSASFAMLGDIIVGEEKALVGFAGPRVIKQTIGQDLPDGFQKTEFLRDHGFVDIVVERENMRDTLKNILKLHKDSE